MPSSTVLPVSSCSPQVHRPEGVRLSRSGLRPKGHQARAARWKCHVAAEDYGAKMDDMQTGLGPEQGESYYEILGVVST